MSDQVIAVQQLGKIFRQGFWRKRVEALSGVSFTVAQGTIFGFLGPNGAGKTTAIKILTGLIKPTSGSASIFGHAVPSATIMKRVGFLPENAYVYPYLTPREFLEMCGRLSGLSGQDLYKRAERVLDRVGMLYAADRQVRRLSKGMLQRTCLGAALIADPDLLILDEPMSGLDPVGRKEVRDIILEEREHGRTVFFSSHILADVESMCDCVSILRRGKVVVEGDLRDLLRGEVLRTELIVRGEDKDCALFSEKIVAIEGVKSVPMAHGLRIDIEGEERVPDVLRLSFDFNVRVAEVTPRRATLEDLFVERAIGGGRELETGS
ncbi:MAG: ABC transporter ATP-binding protein [Deltaproteobacteria bacterium]|nr:ABC transporter ATP-binding protein [Deltaproteobacteria bacterium]